MILKERWTNLDWGLVGSIGLVAAVIRSVRLGTPKELVFDEFFYVPDACRYMLQIKDICGPTELTWMHPPLGKWMIAFGLQVLGPNRYGWRLMAVVAGVATIALVYVVGRCLFESRVGSVVAAGLLTFDFLHFTHSRLGMPDVFLTMFITLAVLLAVIDRDDSAHRGWFRPWRWGAGAALGAALATKWAAVPLFGAVVVLTLLWDRRGRRDRGESRAAALGSTGIAFVLIPLLVYLVSYAGRFDGALLTAPWASGSWFADLFQRHTEMLDYHTASRITSTLPPHPAASPAWSWLALKRPIAYWYLETNGFYREIMAMGHVLLWPLAIPALAWLGTRATRIRDARSPSAIVTTLFLAAYVPWILLSFTGQDVYPYYLLPGIPFMYLGFGVIADRWRRLAWGRPAIGVVALAAVGLWFFYAPVLTTRPLSPEAWERRILFKDCVSYVDPVQDRLGLEVDLNARSTDERLTPTRTKATGWCWV